MTYIQTSLELPQPKSGTRLVEHICKHCGHPSGHSYFEYHRSYNKNMALALYLLWKENTTEFIHMEDLILSKVNKRCGDFSYLVHYSHIEKMEGEHENGSKKNGMYRIKATGIAFAEGRTTVRQKFIMRDGEFMGFEGDLINIWQVPKFKYKELMGESIS